MKKYYVTFGQIHTHYINGKTFNKDCVAEIEAENRNEAHDIAIKIFDGVFCRVTEDPDLEFYPRGIIKIK